MNAVLTSLELSQEIEAVEHELSELRARAEEDSSAFAALEQQVAEIGENLARTHSTISKHEARLADKQAELAKAKRLEALANYKKDLRAQHEASTRVVRAATDLIATLNAYDDETLRLRKLVEEMRYAFGNDERVAEVEAALEHEPEELLEAWAAVVGTLGWRVNGTNGGADGWDPEVLAEELAQQRRVARIKEYFSRS